MYPIGPDESAEYATFLQTVVCHFYDELNNGKTLAVIVSVHLFDDVQPLFVKRFQ